MAPSLARLIAAAVVGAALYLPACNVAAEDIITKKDGEEIHGDIVNRDPFAVKIRTYPDGVEKEISKSSIESIQGDGKPPREYGSKNTATIDNKVEPKEKTEKTNPIPGLTLPNDADYTITIPSDWLKKGDVNPQKNEPVAPAPGALKPCLTLDNDLKNAWAPYFLKKDFQSAITNIERLISRFKQEKADGKYEGEEEHYKWYYVLGAVYADRAADPDRGDSDKMYDARQSLNNLNKALTLFEQQGDKINIRGRLYFLTALDHKVLGDDDKYKDYLNKSVALGYQLALQEKHKGEKPDPRRRTMPKAPDKGQE